MRIFCTCNCRQTEKDLAKAQDQLDSLERRYAELNSLYMRLQGRYAREQRGSGDGTLDERDSPGRSTLRGNPRAIELLEKGRR